MNGTAVLLLPCLIIVQYKCEEFHLWAWRVWTRNVISLFHVFSGLENVFRSNWKPAADFQHIGNKWKHHSVLADSMDMKFEEETSRTDLSWPRPRQPRLRHLPPHNQRLMFQLLLACVHVEWCTTQCTCTCNLYLTSLYSQPAWTHTPWAHSAIYLWSAFLKTLNNNKLINELKHVWSLCKRMKYLSFLPQSSGN